MTDAADLRPRTPEEEAGIAAMRRQALKVEIAGESFLLLLVTVFFGQIILESTGVFGPGWPLGAALTPWIAVSIGIPFLIARIVYVVRAALRFGQHADVAKTVEIMDVGFTVSDDPKADRQRFFRIIIAIGLLYLSIWLIGFHVSLPLWVGGYLYFYGNVSARWSIGMGLFFLCFILGVYDYVLEVPWGEPLVVQWIKPLFPDTSP
jgi:hypothetical protein